jgi:putative redox protein
MRRDVQFPNAAGALLWGALEQPPGRVRAVALFAHCFTCNSNSHGARRVSLALAERGIACLRFDFTGLGKSKGAFADSHFAANIGDLVAAARYLEETIGAPALLIGHSLGGAAVIAAAEHVPSAKAVVTIGAPFDPEHVLHQFGPGLDRIEAEGQGEIAIGGRPFTIGRDFVAAVRGQDQAGRLARLKRALLVLHAATDPVIGIENAADIYAAAKHPKSFVSLDGADHLLTGAEHAAYAAAIIAAWVEPFLAPVVRSRAVAEGDVRVTAGDGKFVQLIDSAGHSFLADEPMRVGGGDLGPTPYDLLLAGLGACTAMTIKLVAAREDIPLAGVEVELRHSRHHAEDSAAPDGKPRLERIERVVRLDGALSAEHSARLLAIADRCPVHRTLESHPEIVTRLDAGRGAARPGAGERT